ncbi:MAG: hypothetical protein IT381_20210 [Deltaproteobacteria bacterium]|nr:hypothetical protein [Deltaproteobacteria bacterium]
MIVLALALLAAAPQEVRVGVYLKNVDGLDFRNNSYSLSFDLWLRWKGEIDPTKTLLLANAIDNWAMTMVPAYEQPKTLDDGSRYQRFTVEGRFYHKFWLGTFPLDWQKVVVEIEDTAHPPSALVYVADPAAATRADLTLPGWDIVEKYNVAAIMQLDTTRGEGTVPGETRASVSRYRYGLKIMRSPSYFWFKVLPPILMVIVSCFFVIRLQARSVDVRAGTIVVALLTEVFLQQQFEAPLPGVGLQFLLDHVFNLSYFVMVALLVESIIVARLWDRALRLDEQHLLTVQRRHDAALAAAPNAAVQGVDYASSALPGDALRRLIDRCDRLCFIGAPVLYVFGCVLIVWLTRGQLII